MVNLMGTFKRYLELGHVQSIGLNERRIAKALSSLTQTEPKFRPRRALAGPNDILHILMPAELWRDLLPWAKAVGFGAAGFVGNHLVHKFIDSKTDKKVEAVAKKIDELSCSLNEFQEAILRSRENWDSPEPWDIRFGLRSADEIEEDTGRSMVGMPVDLGSLDTAADAILALNLIGPKLQSAINAFMTSRLNDQDIRKVAGIIRISSDGNISADLNYHSSEAGPSTDSFSASLSEQIED